jgi:hypothetical protein
MTITITATFATPAEAADFLARAAGQVPPAVVVNPPAKGNPEADTSAAPAPTVKTTVVKTAAPAPTLPTAEAAKADAPAQKPAIEYAQLQKAVFKLAALGDDQEPGEDSKTPGARATAEVAASFGVKTFKTLPADQWADALAAVEARAAELQAELQAEQEQVA